MKASPILKNKREPETFGCYALGHSDLTGLPYGVLREVALWRMEDTPESGSGIQAEVREDSRLAQIVQTEIKEDSGLAQIVQA